MQGASGDSWSANAAQYAKFTLDADEGPIHRPSKVLLQRMNQISPLANASACLDVGCGPGTTVGKMIEEYGSQIRPQTRIIASDFSAGMIQQVKARKNEASDNSLWQQVETRVLDAQELAEIPDRSISHVMASLVFNLVDDGQKAMKAAHRVLETDGVLAITIWANVEWINLMLLAAKSIRGEVSSSFRFPEGFDSVDGVRKTFRDTGFEGEVFEEFDCFMDASDPGPLIQGFVCSNNPGALQIIGDYTDEEKERYAKEFLRLVEERHPHLPRKLRGVAVVAVGRKRDLN